MCGVMGICVANYMVGAVDNCLEELFGYEGEVLCEVLLSDDFSLSYILVNVVMYGCY